ncbi:MAG: DUF6165 family protein [Opitutaceae bacterium]
MSEILVPVSFGELLDKISILEIKGAHIRDEAKLANIRRELEALRRTWLSAPESKRDIAARYAALKQVNERLWKIEDDIRLKERAGAFDDEFIRLARSVYFENDERARIKREINAALGSKFIEEKSYEGYRPEGGD